MKHIKNFKNKSRLLEFLLYKNSIQFIIITISDNFKAELHLRTEINFQKIFNFLKPFSIAKRFQNSQNALKAVKTIGAAQNPQACQREVGDFPT